MRRDTFGFAYGKCAYINRIVCAFLNKSVCAGANGTVAFGYTKHRLICVDVIRNLLICTVNWANRRVRISGACCLHLCKAGLLVVHLHAYWAYWMCMCKQRHAACSCVKRTCCMYKCEFIYMQTRGCCVFMCKPVLMVLHVLDYTEMHICTRHVTILELLHKKLCRTVLIAMFVLTGENPCFNKEIHVLL